MGKSAKMGKVDKSSSFVGICIYVYTAIMAILFLIQVSNFVNKYQSEKIVEEERMLYQNSTEMPALTLCVFPGYKGQESDGDNILLEFESICPNRTDFKECIDQSRFSMYDIFKFAFSYPAKSMLEAIDLDSVVMTNYSFNLVSGSCFTFQVFGNRSLSQENLDMLAVDMNKNSPFAGNHMLTAHVHEKDRFMPSLGISQELMGQQAFYINPVAFGMPFLSMEVRRRNRLNTANHQCQEDPKYNIIQCMEDYITSKAGCKSPWDIFPSDIRNCSSREEFSRLFEQHKFVYTTGAPQFTSVTGCLPPCTYDVYLVERRHTVNEMFTNIFGNHTRLGGVCIGIKDNNVVVLNDRRFYSFSNLIGNVGGCLGMFLGASFVSLYKFAVDAAAKGSKYV